MKIVELKIEDWSGLVFAVHDDAQSVAGLYGPNATIYSYAGPAPTPGDPLPAEAVEVAEPLAEWVAKRPFVSAITTLLPDEAKAALADSWQTQAWIAKLPGDMVNLLDPEVSAFLTAAGLTLEQIRAKMEG